MVMPFNNNNSSSYPTIYPYPTILQPQADPVQTAFALGKESTKYKPGSYEYNLIQVKAASLEHMFTEPTEDSHISEAFSLGQAAGNLEPGSREAQLIDERVNNLDDEQEASV